MALPATHIRFAVALAEHLSVADMAAYLSGTVYPDSRWITGLEREHTHDRRFLEPNFASDDFSLGWHIHCVCDQIQGDIHGALLGDLFQLSPDERWIRMAAAKAVQDAKDATRGGIAAYLSFLTDSRTPNGESGGDVSAYLQLVRDVYSRNVPPAWSDYEALWEGVGLDRKRISRIEKQAGRIREDKKLVSGIYGAFQQIVDRWHHGTVDAKQVQRRRK